VILVGGNTCSPLAIKDGACESYTPSGATWAYRDGTWINITSEVGAVPAYPYGPEASDFLVYDSADASLVLFWWPSSAYGGGHAFPATWVLGATWSNLSLPASDEPPSEVFLEEGVAAYDARDGYIVLFGDGNQTWTFAANRWTNATGSIGTAPPAQTPGMLTWDAYDDCLLLYGGWSETRFTFLNQTWEFGGGHWTNVTNFNDTPPLDSQGYLEYDPGTSDTILFAGTLVTAGGGATEMNYTWGFSGGTWTNLTTSVGSELPPPTLSIGSPAAVDLLAGYDVFLDQGNSTLWGTPQTWAFGSVPIPFLRVSAPETESGTPVSFNATILAGTSPFDVNYTGLPPGCVAPTQANFTCTPSAPANDSATYSVVLNVTGANGRYGDVSESVEVFRGLTATGSITATRLELGMNFTGRVSAVPGILPIAYRYVGLPPGCSSTDQPTLLCVPTAVGNFSIEAEASDGGGQNRTFNWTVQVFPALRLELLSAGTILAETGSGLALAWISTGGAPPIKLEITGLPSGCVPMNRSPILCSPVGSGSYSVTLQESDDLGVVVSQSVAIQVASRLVLRSLTVVPGSNLSLGSGFLLGVNASAGVGPYRYSYSNLPTGCATADQPTLDCVPTTTGSWSIAVDVTDALGVWANGSVEVSVRAGTTFALSLEEWGVVVVGLAAVGAAGVIVLRRRRAVRSPPSEESTDAEVESGR
jgi:hypothetical protein